MTLNSLLYYRSRLDAHDQAIYDDLFRHWMHLDDNFTIERPHCELLTLTQAIHWDNPILFYIDYYTICYHETSVSVDIQGGYLYDRETIRRYLADCENWGRQIIKKLPNVGINEKALWLHDVVIANVRYGDPDNINAHNLIGVIRDKVAVCEGISKAYKYLCDLANIPCIFVAGKLDEELHGWNLLWVGGGASFVDVTNDMRNGGGYTRNHFLRSADQMIGYSWDTALIPDCRIHNTSNAFFTVRNKREFVDTLRKNGSKDSLCLNLRFDRQLDEAGINALLRSCALAYPLLIGREISYSLEQQMVYIR